MDLTATKNIPKKPAGKFKIYSRKKNVVSIKSPFATSYITHYYEWNK